MGRITVSQTQDYFIKDQKPFFYLGDTIWMAFSKLTIEKWKQYLCYRKTQGFTVIQASLSRYAMTTHQRKGIVSV